VECDTGQVHPHILKHGSPFETLELLTPWQSVTSQKTRIFNNDKLETCECFYSFYFLNPQY
jgi:hypothetical protein